MHAYLETERFEVDGRMFAPAVSSEIVFSKLRLIILWAALDSADPIGFAKLMYSFDMAF